MPRKSRALTICCSGKRTEPEKANSWSFKNAMTLPAKLTDPMSMVSGTVIAATTLSSPPLSAWTNSESAMSAAAPPPRPL
jgi:hypothetical protein